MRVLFISTEIWSEKNPEGIVARKLLNGLIENNLIVDLLTTNNTNISSLNKEYVVNDNTIEIISKLQKKITGIEKQQFVKYILSNLEKYEIQKYDLILTRSEPFFIHEIGYNIKKRYPAIKWIASFGDPVFLNPYNSKSLIKRKIAKKLERKYWQTSNFVTHTNQTVLDEYINAGFPRDKCFVLENPFIHKNNDESVNYLSNNNNPLKPLKFAYIGSLYGKRTIHPVIKLFSEMNFDFELIIVGGIRNTYYENRYGILTKFLSWKDKRKIFSPINKYNLQNKIKFLPFMQKDALDVFINNNVDVLINIDAKIGKKNLFLSSKIVEYLQYGKPILNFSIPGATVNFLKSVGIFYYVDISKNSYDKLDLSFFSEMIPRQNIEYYTSRQVIRRLINKLQRDN
jgi:hypothetical protein